MFGQDCTVEPRSPRPIVMPPAAARAVTTNGENGLPPALRGAYVGIVAFCAFGVMAFLMGVVSDLSVRIIGVFTIVAAVGSGITTGVVVARRERDDAVQREARIKASAEDDRQRNRAIAAAGRRAHLEALADAAATAQRARELGSTFEELRRQFAGRMEDARDRIYYAEREFAANAYGPFWDEIERAVGAFAYADEALRAMRETSDDYYGLLRGRRHNFPALDVKDLSSNSCDAWSLKEVVRRAQSDINFALIWEHRRTRDVLVEGFKTLGESIDSVADSLEWRLKRVMDAVGDGFRDVSQRVDDLHETVKTLPRSRASFRNDE